MGSLEKRMDAGEYVSRIDVPPEYDLSDLGDGEVGQTKIYLTKGGDIFIWLDAKGPHRVWKKNGTWYGELAEPLTQSNITGYRSIDKAEGVPLLLAKEDPNLLLTIAAWRSQGLPPT
jgi:hypothetical protein